MMASVKKLLFSLPVFLVGLLLVLAGLNFVTLSPNLFLYIGIILLLIAVFSYILDRSKKGGDLIG